MINAIASTAPLGPSAEQSAHFAERLKIDPSFWELPLAEQLTSPKIESFYLAKITSDGMKYAEVGSISLDDITFIENYLADRIEQEVQDPSSKFYHQFKVEKVLVERNGKFGILNQKPVLYFTPNPELSAAEKGPFAKFLDLWFKQFGPNFKIAIDHDALFLMGFGGAWDKTDLPQEGTLKLGDHMLGEALQATSLEDILSSPLLMHEFYHAYHDAIYLQGKLSYLHGMISHIGPASTNEIYHGNFELDEISTYTISARNTMLKLQKLLRTENQSSPTGKADLADFHKSGQAYFKYLRHFSDQTADVLGQLQKDLAALAEATKTSNKVFLPFLEGEYGIQIPVKLKDAANPTVLRQFYYTLPYTVLTSVQHPEDPNLTPAQALRKELADHVFNGVSSIASIEQALKEDPAAQLKKIAEEMERKQVRNQQILVDAIRFIDEQLKYVTDFKTKIGQIEAAWKVIDDQITQVLAGGASADDVNLAPLIKAFDSIPSPFEHDQGKTLFGLFTQLNDKYGAIRPSCGTLFSKIVQHLAAASKL